MEHRSSVLGCQVVWTGTELSEVSKKISAFTVRVNRFKQRRQQRANLEASRKKKTFRGKQTEYKRAWVIRMLCKTSS
jgi:hypothetical protein